MGKIGETLDPDFVISVGDNFYDTGLKSVDDPAFKESFMNIYTAPSLQKQWYLGNHLLMRTKNEDQTICCILFSFLNFECYCSVGEP